MEWSRFTDSMKNSTIFCPLLMIARLTSSPVRKAFKQVEALPAEEPSGPTCPNQSTTQWWCSQSSATWQSRITSILTPVQENNSLRQLSSRIQKWTRRDSTHPWWPHRIGLYWLHKGNWQSRCRAHLTRQGRWSHHHRSRCSNCCCHNSRFDTIPSVCSDLQASATCLTRVGILRKCRSTGSLTSCPSCSKRPKRQCRMCRDQQF